LTHARVLRSFSCPFRSSPRKVFYEWKFILIPYKVMLI